MKPRTKEEIKVLTLSERLKPLSRSAIDYAYSHCFENIGLYWKDGRVWCQCCGHKSKMTFSLLAVSLRCANGYKCPHCGKPLKLKYHRDSDSKTNEFKQFSVFQTYMGYQVIRTFEVSRCNKGFEQTNYNAIELFQNWFNTSGKEIIIGRDSAKSFMYFKWNYHSHMNIKKHNGGGCGYYSYTDTYEVSGNFFYPHAGITKLLRRNGWKMELCTQKNLDVLWIIKTLLKMNDGFVEELVKHRQYSVLSFWMNTGMRWKDRSIWKHVIRICERNNYIIEDASLFFDYLDLLFYFHLDTHNAHYVCPVDLKAAHDRLLEKKNRIEEKKELERKIEEEKMYEQQYHLRMQKFFGLSFGTDKIYIEPLHSVQEFAEEGISMHHCVFTMGYYDKKRHPNSLILSAKDNQGKRLETIEVNTKSWKVIQSRGVNNGKTEFHEDIIKLVNSYIPQMRKVNNKRRYNKAKFSSRT